MELKSYIIQLDAERNFFTFLREGLVYGTEFPSFATNMVYEVADEVCRRIREKGYFEAVVCDIFGVPATAASLETAKPVSASKVREFWNDRLNLTAAESSEQETRQNR